MARSSATCVVVGGLLCALLIGGCPATPTEDGATAAGRGNAPAVFGPTSTGDSADAPANRNDPDGDRGTAPIDDATDQPADDREQALLADCDGDGIPDWQEVLNGADPCDSDAPIDTDGDGIPNFEDPDIDGDGFPNRIDVDVDGDGMLNGADSDVDGDGIPNEDDSDVDGDFIFNRLDFDVDGDGELDPFDADDDADGKPDEEDDDEDELNPCAAGADDVIDPEDCSRDVEEEELDPWLAQLGDVFEESTFDAFQDLAQLTDVFVDGELADAVEALTDLAEGELADQGPMASADDLSRGLDTRVDVAIDVGTAAAPENVAELTESTDRIVDAARLADEGLAPFIATVAAVAETEVDPDLSDTTDTSLRVLERAADANIDLADVPETIDEAARTAADLDGDMAGIEVAFEIIVELSAERSAQSEDGESDFSLVSIAKTLERTAEVLGDPGVEALTESCRNILAAAADAEVSDPVAVVDAVAEAGGGADGTINADEAAAGAQAVSDAASMNP